MKKKRKILRMILSFPVVMLAVNYYPCKVMIESPFKGLSNHYPLIIALIILNIIIIKLYIWGIKR